MRPNRIALIGALCTVLAAGAPAFAQGKGKQQPQPNAPKAGQQQPPQRQQPPGPPPGGQGMAAPEHGGGPNAEVMRVLMEDYYMPEMVRDLADELNLTDEQVDKLRKAMTDVRTEVDQLEWDVSRENRKLAKLLREHGSKEQVYAQMDAVFSYENKIKKKMLGLMVVVRDVLTQQQRDQLDKMKAEWEKNRPMMPGMGGAQGGPQGGPQGGCPMRGMHHGGPQGGFPPPPSEDFTPGPAPEKN
jgi:Spy/CpxP family protein refolding chaperone